MLVIVASGMLSRANVNVTDYVKAVEVCTVKVWELNVTKLGLSLVIVYAPHLES